MKVFIENLWLMYAGFFMSLFFCFDVFSEVLCRLSFPFPVLFRFPSLTLLWRLSLLSSGMPTDVLYPGMIKAVFWTGLKRG